MRRVVSGGFGVERDVVEVTCRGEHGVRARVGGLPLRIRHSRFAALYCGVMCYAVLCCTKLYQYYSASCASPCYATYALL